MADEAVTTQAQPEVKGEIIRGTEDELYKRFTDDPAFYDTYLKAQAEGRVEIIAPGEDKPVETSTAEVKPEVKAEAKPEAKAEEKLVPATATTTEPPDEDMAVTIKKSQLGDFKTIGEKLKAADEAASLVAFLKEETKRKQTEVDAGAATAEENARIKKELDELKAKTVTATADAKAKDKAVEAVKPDAKALDDMVTFDDFDGLDQEALEAKLFESATQLRVIKGLKQTAKVAEYARNVEAQNKALEAKIAALENTVRETNQKQAEFFTKQEQATKTKEQELENEKLFASIGEWLGRTPELKTKSSVKELNAKYTDFVETLTLAVKPKSQKELESALTQYFYDQTAAGDKFRADCEAKGIVPPEENDKFLQIMEIKGIVDKTNLSLDEAYAAYKVRNKIKPPDPKEQERIQAAIAERAKAASTMDSDKVNAQSQVEGVEDSTIEQIVASHDPSEIKKDEALRKRVDAYCERNGFPLFSWDKY